MNNKIDFVVLWVDGSDKNWLKDKQKYKPDLDITASANRFRDWDLLKYWFRGVEKFAPWVNNVYFITYGHLPAFLNIDNPKIKIINHEDFIDKKNLPLFNSSAIEIGINHIKGLSEQFVLFNDDIFLMNDVKETDFFINGVPCDEYAENIIAPADDVFFNILYNNTRILNRHFDKRKQDKLLKSKRLNIKYGKQNIKTLLLSAFSKYVGFHNPHIAQAFLKSSFDKLWEIDKEECESTQSHKFRDPSDISQYAVRYLQLVEGNFVPRSSKFGKYLEIHDSNINEVCDTIKNQKYHVVCLNDTDESCDFEKDKKALIEAFDKILPEKSSFEK